MDSLFSKIKNAIEPEIVAMGYEVVSVTEEREEAYNGRKAIVVTINKPGGIVIDDTVKVTKRIKPILTEQTNLLPDSHVLVVSSPGFENDM